MLSLQQVLTAFSTQRAGADLDAVGMAWETPIPMADQRIWFERAADDDQCVRLRFRTPFVGWLMFDTYCRYINLEKNHDDGETFTFRIDVNFRPLPPSFSGTTFHQNPPFELGILFQQAVESDGKTVTVAFIRRGGRIYLSSSSHATQADAAPAYTIRSLSDLVRLVCDPASQLRRVWCQQTHSHAVDLRVEATDEQPFEWHSPDNGTPPRVIQHVDLRFYHFAPHCADQAVVAVCMGLHRRLGRESPLGLLDDELLRLVVGCAQEETNNWMW